jgi:flagellar hook-length control protein FliK
LPATGAASAANAVNASAVVSGAAASAGARGVTASGAALPAAGMTAGGAAAALAASDASAAAANQASIVSAIHGQLLPGGGTMQIRLDPASLGPVDVTVRMSNGVMSASFQTSTEDATRLLSRNLGQLKTALEQQGVTVQKLHVQQGSGSSTSGDSSGKGKSDYSSGGQDATGRQSDQRRRQALSRMWSRASGMDDLDAVA